MKPVYLTQVYQRQFDENLTKKEPRDRFIQYYEDLHKIYECGLSRSTFYEGAQYSFTELGTAVLDLCAKDNQLKGVNPVIFVTWGHEFDPDHCSCGPFFTHAYSFSGRVFDVSDQGTIASFTALNIAQLYMQDDNYDKALVVGLEQTTTPRDKSVDIIIPTVSAAIAVFLQDTPNSQRGINYRLVKSTIVNGRTMSEHRFDISLILRQICMKLEIDYNQIAIVMKQGSAVWNFYQESTGKWKMPLHPSIGLLDSRVGSIQCLMYLDSLLEQTDMSRLYPYIAIIDGDVESLDVGLVLLEVIM